MKKTLSALLVLIVALGYSFSAVADGDYKGPMDNQIYLSPGIAYLRAPDGIDIDQGETGPGVALGIGFTDRLAGEIFGSWIDMDYDLPGGVSGSEESDAIWFDLLYKFTDANGRWQPFAILGGGRTEYDYENSRRKFADNQYNAGVGLFGQMSPRFLLRADVRGVYSNEEGGVEPMAFVGFTGLLGNIEPPAPVDTDGDGVPDVDDKCPGTPPGIDVGADGCELIDNTDSDGDGVPDRIDSCPNTPAGAPVDARGCALDSDGDGVPDYMDECPDSAAGAKVNAKGCYEELQEEVTIDLNLEFDSNSSDLRQEHYAEIQDVVTFLRSYPTTNAVLEGHTDSDGSQAYNQSLSERRAQAVLEYLINTGGITASRMSSVGYGETRPISTNETAIGKQRNRRVAVKVSGTATVTP